MPTKKDSKKSDNKSYLNKRSNAQLDDIISQFGYEDVLEAEPVKTDGAVTEDAIANRLNNEDEYGLDDFKTDDSLSSVADNDNVADNAFTDFREEPTSNMLNEDEYGVSELDGFDSVKAEEPAKDTMQEDEYGIAELDGFDSAKAEESPALDERSNADEPNDFADQAASVVQEPEQQLGEFVVEAVEEPCAVIELVEECQEPTIDISLDDMKEHDAEIDYSYDLDSGFRPSKRMDNMKKERVVKGKTTPQAGEAALSEPAMPTARPTEPAVVSVPASDVSEPHSAPKAKLVFSPKTDKINKRLRKKYKIDKDSIFSENDYVDGFILANNETLLRRYDALKVNGGNVGRILITNKRMLFNTSEKAEIPLSAVEGLRSAKYWAISWAKFIFSILLLGIAAFAFIYDFTTIDFFTGKTWLIYTIMGVGGLFALIGLILLFSFARRRFALKIFINSSYEFITYNSKKRKKEGAVMESVIFAKPGKELDKMVREIGALIIQSREGFFD